MPTSIREQLIDAVTTAVGGEYFIPAANDDRDLPVIIVQDGIDVATPEVYDSTNIETPFVIGSAASATSTDKDVMRAQANELLAALVTAMFADETFGGLADSVEYTGGGISAEVGKFVFAEANFTVKWHHQRGDPYTID